MGSIAVSASDIMNGQPADGMELVFSKLHNSQPSVLKTCFLNSKGHADVPLLNGQDFSCGAYRLEVNVENYFKTKKIGTSFPEESSLMRQVVFDFYVVDQTINHEIQLLIGLNSYSVFISYNR